MNYMKLLIILLLFNALEDDKLSFLKVINNSCEICSCAALEWKMACPRYEGTSPPPFSIPPCPKPNFFV